jgi:hypothetical protein
MLARFIVLRDRNAAYLAPMTMVLLLRTNFSSSVYKPPGIVPNAVHRQPQVSSPWKVHCLRPVNSASVTNVPYSDSKRSISGVTATRLKIMWKKLRCMSGNRLRRCTTQFTWSALEHLLLKEVVFHAPLPEAPGRSRVW